jgi:Outer membrane protein beta-barrel domain
MYISNARHLRHLHSLQKIAQKAPFAIGKTTFVVLLIFCFLGTYSVSSQAQVTGKGNYNFLDFNKRNYYFGITLAYNKSDYRIFRSKNFLPAVNDSIAGIEGIKGPGFNLQIVSNLKIGEYFDLRFLPGFSFADRSVEYDPTRKNAKNFTKDISSVFVELPFHVRYKSAPYYDKRVFVMGGVKYSYDIQAKSRQRTFANNLRISPTDFQVEMGAGIQMFFPYFIFSPEIKFSHGLGNILIFQNGSRESSVIEKLMSRTFTISLHFEG